MSTLDPFSDFYLPGPAAKENDDDRDPDLHLRDWPDDEPDDEHFYVDDDADHGDAHFGIEDDGAVEAADEVAGIDDDGGEVSGEESVDDADRQAQPWSGDKRHDAETTTATAAAGRRGGVVSLVAALVILSGLLGGGWYVMQPQTLPIRQVNVEGEFRELSRMELQQLVAEHLRGGFFSVDVTALRNAVTASPWVREVQVQRVWPDALKIAVREQVAVARWNDSGLVNSSGDYFRPDNTARFDELPQLSGPQGMQAQLTSRLQQLQEAMAPLGLQVSQLQLSERRAWSFVTASGLEVVLGREDFDTRLERFIELVPDSLGERLQQAAYIDMRYTNGFAVRFADEAGSKAGKGHNDGNGAA